MELPLEFVKQVIASDRKPPEIEIRSTKLSKTLANSMALPTLQFEVA